MSESTPTLQTLAGRCPAFEILRPPVQTLPIVFSSPHSGRVYPRAFMESAKLSADAIRRSEDLFVDQLFDFVPSLGAPLLFARFPRAFLDVNREPYELDPKMFDADLPGFANVASVRVAGGLGTIPRIVAEKEEIYRGRLSVAEGLDRIETIYKPYHASLEALLRETRERFGMALLLDCHSMPSTVRALPGGRRPDIVVGDRFGTSASGRMVAQVVTSLARLGYDVTRNKPYAGGYITERYGSPATGIHAIQIEINRGLYADEQRYVPTHMFDAVRGDLCAFVTELAAAIGADFGYAAAAE
ncbi:MULTISPECIES: N-formylglutamate amidohydrolase [unclassified Aureimonas]|uniref:N-formylglutamate amidohydrolase n=1 Tax=unclassified Aureimonas TaxID=2615206 RepID=UPI0006FD5981|nr:MULTISPECIES: N-formylglutamate amidohydrolase [unclassified Aureimonas]KQT52106.1 N-formylglutamate amidohydrolase [Aureimonas sp. Leaf427]KQT70661.1 N-formylglutamate amidohydrolase [Aureimonas sp. Leaf460]